MKKLENYSRERTVKKVDKKSRKLIGSVEKFQKSNIYFYVEAAT